MLLAQFPCSSSLSRPMSKRAEVVGYTGFWNRLGGNAVFPAILEANESYDTNVQIIPHRAKKNANQY